MFDNPHAALTIVCSMLPAVEDALIAEVGEDVAMDIMRELIIHCRML
jgi:hypothetical protein